MHVLCETALNCTASFAYSLVIKASLPKHKISGIKTWTIGSHCDQVVTCLVCGLCY